MSVRLEQVILLVSLDGAVRGWVGNAGKHEALVHLVIIQEGLVGLVDGSLSHDPGARAAGTSTAGVWQGQTSILSGVQDVLVVIDLQGLLAIRVDKLDGVSGSHGDVLGASSGGLGTVGQEESVQSTENTSEGNPGPTHVPLTSWCLDGGVHLSVLGDLLVGSGLRGDCRDTTDLTGRHALHGSHTANSWADGSSRRGVQGSGSRAVHSDNNGQDDGTNASADNGANHSTHGGLRSRGTDQWLVFHYGV
mmetsp:Transcript_99197/g.167199  ORF Transcript_99197/g.167199 Transcript_99197/m.167199 type:complete len:249 (+) Transcript_99197:1047-1793(+)